MSIGGKKNRVGVGAKKGQTRRGLGLQTRLTEEREEKFLDVLRDTGVFDWAALQASPGRTKTGAASTFRTAMYRDPEFAAEVEAARAEALSRLEKTAYERGLHGHQRPIYQRGRLVGHETVYDNALLLRVLARYDSRWAAKSRIEGHITHDVRQLVLTPDDILLLAPQKRDSLLRLLEEIDGLKPEEVRDETA